MSNNVAIEVRELTKRYGELAAVNVITFPMMFLSGTFFQLSQMPQFLQNNCAGSAAYLRQ